MLSAPEHQEMNGRVEVTWRTLCMIAHSLMVHAQVSGAYTHFSLMYMAYHILSVLPIKDLINEDDNLTTPFKLETGMKPSILHYLLYFSVCCKKIYCTCWVLGDTKVA